MKWVAFQDTQQGIPQAFDESVLFQRQQRIVGTGGIKTAGSYLEGRQVSLIKNNDTNGKFFEHIIYADAQAHWQARGKPGENLAAQPPSWQ
jgi:hypothetical protein